MRTMYLVLVDGEWICVTAQQFEYEKLIADDTMVIHSMESWDDIPLHLNVGFTPVMKDYYDSLFANIFSHKLQEYARVTCDTIPC